MLGYRFGLKPNELYSTTLYDFNMMAKAYQENMKHDYRVMRTNAYLVSVYSGLEGKARKKLTPEKMLNLGEKTESNKISREDALEIMARSNKRRGVC